MVDSIQIIGYVILALLIVLIIPYYSNVKDIVKDVVSFISGIGPWFKRNKIKSDVEVSCKNTIDSLNQITPELNLPDLSLKWVKKEEDGTVLLEEGKAIVLLSYNRDNIKNIINTTTAYVRKALIPSARNFLSIPVRKAVDFTIIRHFINNNPAHSVASTAFVAESLDEITTYNDTFHKVSVVDEEGMLSRLLLREYALWGSRIVAHLPSPDYAKESSDFLDFLYDLLSREPEEFTPLQFVGKDIKVGVLLVAKLETYTEYGLYPYLKRIRQGFASGIKTFYLLARNDKIGILEKVYSELVATGNFNLQNGPKVFKDTRGRDNIVYCIEVDSQGSMAKDYQAMSKYVEDGEEIEVIVEQVFFSELRCLYNLIPVIIPVEEISAAPNIRLSNYYTRGMAIRAIPLESIPDGKVKASLLKTDSNPQKLIDQNYAVGSFVKAIVQEADDMFINLLVKDSSQKAIAYRKNLTYSRHLFLHKLFPVGGEFDFEIIGADYIHNKLELKYKGLIDPWQNQSYQPGDKVIFTIFREDEGCFVSELDGGLPAILPFSNLTWIQDDIEKERKKYKRNQTIEGFVKSIDKDARVIILTLKSSVSPYETYLNSLSSDNNETQVVFEANNGYGVIGKTNENYRVFIPTSEMHIGETYYSYHLGQTYRVFIKEVAPGGLSLIGTLKPFIETPLQKYARHHVVGQIVTVGDAVSYTDNQAIYKFSISGKEKVTAILYVGDVTNNCRIYDMRSVINALGINKLSIKNLDADRNKVDLSLKPLLESGLKKRHDLQYGAAYDAVIIGNKGNYYHLIIINYWIEGRMQLSSIYNPGTRLKVYLSSNNTELPEFFA